MCTPQSPNVFDTTCPDAGPPPPHSAFAPGSSSCDWTPVCQDGWFDCDFTVPGCESSTDCPNPFDVDAAVTFDFPWRLRDAPLGVAACGSEVVFVEGTRVVSAHVGAFPITLAMLDRQPSGGIACDDSFVYVPVRSSNGVPADGHVVRIARSDGGAIDLVTHANPARSIELDDAGNVYWIARKATGTFVERTNVDASAELLPVSEPQIDKTIGLQQGLWAIQNGDVRHLLADGGIDLIADAAAVALAPRTSGMSVLSEVAGGYAFSRADAGNPLVGVRAIVAWGDDLFVGSDIDILHLAPNKPPAPIAQVGGSGSLADLAVDSKYVYYTMTSPARLDRAAW